MSRTSCPGEATCFLYVEGALEGDARRDVESHLVGCRDCRERVIALREEGNLLGAVMREERPAPARDAAPEPGVAWGVPVAVAASSVALAAAGALFDSRLPGGWDLLHPRRLKGAAEMAFDTVFFLRENAPGLLELALSVGIVASLSALASFAVSALSRRVFDGAALLAFGLLLAPEPASAFAAHRHEDVRIAAGERVEESLVAWGGDRVDVDGVVDGDLIAASERVAIRGEVTGSLYVFCRDLEITGKVGGAVHAIAESTRVEGEIGGAVYAVGEDFTLSRTSRAKSDVNLFAEDAVLEGPVGRDAHIAGERLDVSGEVGRNVHGLWLDELSLRDTAHVRGNVEVRLEEGREIDRAAGARVDGEVRAEQRLRPREHYLDHYRSWRFYAVNLLWYAAAFLFGLFVYWVGPVVFRGAVRTGPELFRALGLGLVVLVMGPVAAVVAALTVVGLPMAVLLVFLYIVALYTADVVVGAWLGRWLAPPADASLLSFGKSFALGLAILYVVALVPFLGPAIGLVALLLGLGLLTARAREALG